MVDRSIKKPMGVLYVVLVKIHNFLLTSDFVILDYKIDHEVSIIIGSLSWLLDGP